MNKNEMYVGAGPVSAHTSKDRQNKGITLIALIITIIVMLILVAVTINMAINGGLFEKAGEAVGDTKNAINAEQQFIDDIMEEYFGNSSDQGTGTTGGETGNVLPTYANAAKDTNGILKANATYTSGEYTAVIPKGFKVIPGINGSTSIADGLVIQDASGNEFVWIPVTYTLAEGSQKDANGLYPEFLEVFYRGNWLDNVRGTTKYTATSGSSYNEPYASGYTSPRAESADYYEMMRSVQNNKGFYIGRYEAGSQDASGNPIARTNTENSTSKVVVKQDQYPYIYVGWGLEMSDYTTPVTYSSKNQGQGALYLSKHMYDEKDIGAISTLCYGIQWDAMLDFIKEDKNVTSSTSWGNYKDNPRIITRTTAKFTTSPSSDSTWTPIPEAGKSKTSSESILLTTGADDSFAAKNIFDIAGNVYEWTNEAYSSAYRVFRGGIYFNFGSDVPASYRNYGTPFSCSINIGFRPALYIKEQ